MNFFEMNKIAGAILISLIFVMLTGMTTDYIFNEEKPEEPGFVIEVASAPGDDAAPVEAEPEVDFAILLASADAAAGEKVAKKCAACHTFEAGGPNRTGPNLHGVVGRTVASVDDFKYSSAMSEFAADKSWDPETLQVFLTKPKDLISKTSMAFAGLKKPKDRANMIAYLKSLSE